MQRSGLLLACLFTFASAQLTCLVPSGMTHYAVFHDVHDGDYKCIVNYGGSPSKVLVKPYNNSQSWKVDMVFNTTSCNGMIDFRVPGKPNPPPVPLLLWYSKAEFAATVYTLDLAVFNDPSGKLADPRLPLNVWTHVSGGLGDDCPKPITRG